VPAGDGSQTQTVLALTGHLQGVPVPQGATVRESLYSPTETRVVLQGVRCGANLDAAYQAAGSSAQRTCAEGVLTLTGSGEATEEWNPWKLDDWRIGPLASLPAVSTGPTYKPHRVTLKGRTARALLTPKNPGRFVDLLGTGLADGDWKVRPRPGGHSYHKGQWTLLVDQDGAQVSLALEAER